MDYITKEYFDAKFDQLMNLMGVMAGQINTLNDKVDNLTERVGSIEHTVKNIEDHLGFVEEKVDVLVHLYNTDQLSPGLKAVK